MIWKMCVWLPVILQDRLFQTDGAVQENDLRLSECVCTEGRQRMEASEEAKIIFSIFTYLTFCVHGIAVALFNPLI